MDALKMAYMLITCTLKFHSWINLSFKDKHNQNNLKYEKHLKCIQNLILS